MEGPENDVVPRWWTIFGDFGFIVCIAKMSWVSISSNSKKIRFEKGIERAKDAPRRPKTASKRVPLVPTSAQDGPRRLKRLMTAPKTAPEAWKTFLDVGLGWPDRDRVA